MVQFKFLLTTKPTILLTPLTFCQQYRILAFPCYAFTIAKLWYINQQTNIDKYRIQNVISQPDLKPRANTV